MASQWAGQFFTWDLAPLTVLSVRHTTVYRYCRPVRLGDHRLMLKGAEQYQSILRVPFLWADPQLPRAQARSSALASTMDIPATILERAKIEPASGMQAKSLLPAIEQGTPVHDAVFVQHDHQASSPGTNIPPRVHSLIDGRYRLSVFHGTGWGELYDLENDPGEFDNLWDDPWQQSYKRGVPQGTIQLIGKVKDETGTRQTFKFDKQIFTEDIDYKFDNKIFIEDIDFRFDTLVQRLREMSFVTRGVTIKFVDERADREMTFYFEGGLTSFVRYLNRNRENLHPVVHVEKDIEAIGIEAAIQYTDAYTESVYSLANTINTIDGGTHLTGLRSSPTRVINDYARKNGMLKDADPNFSQQHAEVLREHDSHSEIHLRESVGWG